MRNIRWSMTFSNRTCDHCSMSDAAMPFCESTYGRKSNIPGSTSLAGPGVDKVANIEDGLPFADGEFDAVVALDLLEHTNNIWFAFDELVRVARRQVVIVLPNVYHWSSRVRFFLGREMDKYALPAQSIVDRHRWLPSYVSARRFLHRAGSDARPRRQGAGVFWWAADHPGRPAALQGVQQSGRLGCDVRS